MQLVGWNWQQKTADWHVAPFMWNIRSHGRRAYINFYHRSRFQIECWSFLSGKKGFRNSWYLHNSGTSFQTGEMQRNWTIDASIRAKGCRSDLLEIPPVSCKVLTHLNGRALCGWLMVKEGSQGQGGWDQMALSPVEMLTKSGLLGTPILSRKVLAYSPTWERSFLAALWPVFPNNKVGRGGCVDYTKYGRQGIPLLGRDQGAYVLT